MRFLADATVVRLARWLRLLGHDVEVEADRAALPKRARAEGRVVLTRSPRLAEALVAAGVEGFCLGPDRAAEQVRTVVARYGRDESTLFERCSRCNAVLSAVSPEDLRGRVWPHVLREHQQFRRCPACGRVYWRGGHVGRMVAFLDRAGVKVP